MPVLHVQATAIVVATGIAMTFAAALTPVVRATRADIAELLGLE